MKSKLSEEQKMVIDLMGKGYELGKLLGTEVVWLQEGGCGVSGKSVDILYSTFLDLFDNGYIKRNNKPHRHTTLRYELTESGKSLINQAIGRKIN